MALEILSPLGDEKSGVRGKWLAHCRQLEKKSLIQFFKDNRFSATFKCAAIVLTMKTTSCHWWKH